MATHTVGLTEAMRYFSQLASEANRAGQNLAVMKGSQPRIVIQPVSLGLRDQELLDVAVDFIDEYSDVFEELAK